MRAVLLCMVVAAVPSGTPVLLDSGVRRGTDVVKALALGATAVGVGKPLFFSLAVGGERGAAAGCGHGRFTGGADTDAQAEGGFAWRVAEFTAS